MRPLLIGQSPSANGSPHAFKGDGSSARRLREMLGADVLKRFDAINLLSRYPGTVFPVALARASADDMLHGMRSRPFALLAGRLVAESFGVGGVEYFSWSMVRGVVRCAVIPHPSGLNRWWNDAANVDRARAFFGAVLESMPRLACQLCGESIRERRLLCWKCYEGLRDYPELMPPRQGLGGRRWSSERALSVCLALLPSLSADHRGRLASVLAVDTMPVAVGCSGT